MDGLSGKVFAFVDRRRRMGSARLTKLLPAPRNKGRCLQTPLGPVPLRRIEPLCPGTHPQVTRD